MFRFCDFTKMIKHVRSLRSWGYAAEATPTQKKCASSFRVGFGAVAPPPLPFGVWTEAHPCFENDKKNKNYKQTYITKHTLTSNKYMGYPTFAPNQPAEVPSRFPSRFLSRSLSCALTPLTKYFPKQKV
jgi:hypothetical protein